MKINPLLQSEIVSRYTSSATSVPKKAEAAKQTSDDTVELSSGAQNYAQLLREARTALDKSDKNEDTRANEIKAAMDAGTYQVSDDDLADALAGHGGIPLYC